MRLFHRKFYRKHLRKKDLRRELALAFTAPSPLRKEMFLKTLPAPQLNQWGFFYTQLQYIRKRTWIFSLMILAACIGIVGISPNGACWKTAALLPFLTLTASAEFAKSAQWNMAELEMGCKYSLSQIFMARFLIFGAADFLLLSIIIGIVSTQSEFYFLRTALYLVTPCIMTAAISLWILRRVPRNGSLYLCAAAAGFISILNDLAGSAGAYFYHPRLLPVWGILFLTALCFLLRQCKELLIKSEEQVWNYI